jgi:hypothetical protein
LIVLMMPTFIVSLCFPKSYLQSEKKLWLICKPPLL